jgi:acyl carrier protein
MGNTALTRQSETPGGGTASRLASVFEEVLSLPADRVRPDLGPVDVERWDSVGHVMLVAAIEEKFSILFDVDEILEFTNFQSILSGIERRMAMPPRDGAKEEGWTEPLAR